MIRRVFALIAAAIAVAILAAFLKPEQADAQSAAPLAAVRHCSQITAATRHRSKDSRVLSSANIARAQRYCKMVHKSASVVNYYQHSGRWTVAPRYHKWWQVPGARWRQLVRKNRMVLHRHLRRLATLDREVSRLLPKPHLVHDSLYELFLCIHTGRIGGLFLTHGEGSWMANTGNSYYGGLQMDLGFMQTYGPEFLARWGTANNWPAWAQIVAGKRAYLSGRGVGPWPVTGPPCAAHLQAQLVQT